MQNQAASAPQPVVSLALDSPDLALAYERTSDPQFKHGQILVKALNIGPGERVLDLGAGTGRLGAYVAELVGPAGQVIAIDPLHLRVDIAQAKAKPNLEARVGRAEDLSQFASDEFDVVYLNSVFHWIADKPRALREIFRVLKPGGRLGLNSADPHRLHQFRRHVAEIFNEQGIDAPANATIPVDQQELQALLSAAGFVHVETRHHTLVDFHPDVDSLIAWSRSSSFGNSLASLSNIQQTQLRDVLAQRLEPFRTPDGLRLERYLIFATARRPAVAGASG